MHSHPSARKQAVSMRLSGTSYPEIERQLGIPRSTLSGWLKSLPLSSEAKTRIDERKRAAVAGARTLAAKKKKADTEEKRRDARAATADIINKIPARTETELAVLAALYLGEGFKRRSSVGLGNSDHRILSLFINLLCRNFHVPRYRLSCYLFLRGDQDAAQETAYWSNKLDIPAEQFRKPQFDKRTLGKKTWMDYHGVCAVYCHDADIARILAASQDLILEKFGAVSSDG